MRTKKGWYKDPGAVVLRRRILYLRIGSVMRQKYVEYKRIEHLNEVDSIGSQMESHKQISFGFGVHTR